MMVARCRPQDAPIKELRGLRDTIVQTVEHDDYPSAGDFAAIAHGVAGGYMLGKSIPGTRKNRIEILARISEDAKPKHSGTARAWNKWFQRLSERAKERPRRTLPRDRSWLPPFLQTNEFDIDGDFKIFVAGGDQGLTLIGPGSKVIKTFQHPTEVTAFALGLLEVINRIVIEREQSRRRSLTRALPMKPLADGNICFNTVSPTMIVTATDK